MDLCKNLSLNIANGRCGADQSIGELTSKQGSLIDYVLLCPELFMHVKSFKVHDYDPMLSDVHKPLEFNFALPSVHTQVIDITNINSNANMAMSKPRWKPGCEQLFKEQLQQLAEDAIPEITRNLNGFEQNNQNSQQDMDSIVTNINEILCKSADNI